MKNALSMFFRMISPQAVLGGLEVSDTELRFAYRVGEQWKFFSEKLVPGLIQSGEIKDYEGAVEALRRLHLQITGKPSRKRISAVVSVSSLNVYSQIFALPVISGENLEKAIELNLSVVSPGNLEEEYAGWHAVEREKNSLNLEVLTAFVNRAPVDRLLQALKDAGFLAVVFEFRALAMTRLFKVLVGGFDPNRSYLVLHLDTDGIDALLIKRGKLYFEYFNFWRDVFQSEEREVPLSVFEAAILRNINQVLNFYTQHGPDSRIEEVFISAGDLQREAAQIVRENFGLVTKDIVVRVPDPVNAEWFVALGSALRGTITKDEGEINFLGEEARQEFRRERALTFFRFWRIAVPTVLGIMVGLFIISNFFLARTREVLEEKSVSSGVDIVSLEALQKKALKFNQSVSIIRAAKQGVLRKVELIEKVQSLAEKSNVTIVSLAIKHATASGELLGEARSSTEIRALKAALEGDGTFVQVNSPISEIRPIPGGQGVSFSMTFFLNSAKAS